MSKLKRVWFYKPELHWVRFSPVALGGDESGRHTIIIGYPFTGRVIIVLSEYWQNRLNRKIQNSWYHQIDQLISKYASLAKEAHRQSRLSQVPYPSKTPILHSEIPLLYSEADLHDVRERMYQDFALELVRIRDNPNRN